MNQLRNKRDLISNADSLLPRSEVGQERHFRPNLAMSVHTPISDMMVRRGK